MIYTWQCEECLKDNELQAPVTDYLQDTLLTCKHCGSNQIIGGFTDIDYSKVCEISKDEAEEILIMRELKGIFIVSDDSRFIGINNKTGDVWTKEFHERIDCEKWLKGE